MIKNLFKGRKFKYLLIFIIILLLGATSYGRYFSKRDVKLKVTAGKLVADVVIDQNPAYIENNIAYFKVIVTNYTATELSGTDIDYNITIKNKTGYKGIYYYTDSDGNNSSPTGEYLPTIKSVTYFFNKGVKQKREFKVFVKSESGGAETVQYDVELNAVQKKMG